MDKSGGGPKVGVKAGGKGPMVPNLPSKNPGMTSGKRRSNYPQKNK